ncbi:hypothetical protein J2S53_003429 [Actinopolyspora lacussalsi]|uniref:DUF1540 domain-containing protein n=1 Tax=Actinopolyspora alba TaxID=673379 RepID=A0A1I1VZX9_9ACTN|nr:DUF1540 domain-containing protein [Actinopolyspora alba]MDP9643484.1 hypothetical protein [Actinopolyspora lacussalsi]SFD86633.1 protein of unknown function [Actinopolyspora alba]
MEMPIVNECDATDCAYNQHQACHALAITVGEPANPRCDTFTTATSPAGDPGAVGHVGACKMSDCGHNVNLECQAPGITVGYQENIVDCLTYAPA